MEILAKNHASLRDSLSSQRFIRLMDDLIKAIMSRTPLNALKYSQSEQCPEREVKYVFPNLFRISNIRKIVFIFFISLQVLINFN